MAKQKTCGYAWDEFTCSLPAGHYAPVHLDIEKDEAVIDENLPTPPEPDIEALIAPQHEGM